MSDYGKVETSFWDKPPSNAFDGRPRELAFFFRTSRHRNLIGTMRLPTAYITDDLRWPREAVEQALGVLVDAGYIVRDAEGWTHVPAQLQIDPPKVANHWKAAFKLAEKVPRNSPAFASLVKQLHGMADGNAMLSAWLRDAIPMPFGMASTSRLDGIGNGTVTASESHRALHGDGIGDAKADDMRDSIVIPAPAPAPAIPPSADAKPRPGAAVPVPLKADWLPDAIDRVAAKALKLPDGQLLIEAEKFRAAAIAAGEARTPDGWHDAWMDHVGKAVAQLAEGTPLDLKAEMFRRGRALLEKLGVKRKDCGSVLGKWRKDHGDVAVITALAKAEVECAQEPIAFIEGVLRKEKRHGKRTDPAEQGRQDLASIVRGMGRDLGDIADADDHAGAGGPGPGGDTGDHCRAAAGDAQADGRGDRAPGPVVQGVQRADDGHRDGNGGLQDGAALSAAGPAGEGLRSDQDDAQVVSAAAIPGGGGGHGQRGVQAAGEHQDGADARQPGEGGRAAHHTGGASAPAADRRAGHEDVSQDAGAQGRPAVVAEDDLLDIPAFLRRPETPAQVH